MANSYHACVVVNHLCREGGSHKIPAREKLPAVYVQFRASWHPIFWCFQIEKTHRSSS
nr:MAG TPA: hypothetical protein [Bacteriophage sp.]